MADDIVKVIVQPTNQKQVVNVYEDGDGEVNVKVNKDTLIRVIERGPQGPPGTGGTSESVEEVYTAAEPISARQVVRIDPDGRVSLASADSIDDGCNVIGIAKTSAIANDPIIVVTSGKVENGPTGVPTDDIYLGLNGATTNVVPTSDVFLFLGEKTSTDGMVLKIQEPIILR